MVQAADVGLQLIPSKGKDIVRLGEMIKIACREQHPVNHPDIDYPGPDILVFRGPADPASGAHSRNAVVMSNGDLDWVTRVQSSNKKFFFCLKRPLSSACHICHQLQLPFF